MYRWMADLVSIWIFNKDFSHESSMLGSFVKTCKQNPLRTSCLWKIPKQKTLLFLSWRLSMPSRYFCWLKMRAWETSHIFLEFVGMPICWAISLSQGSMWVRICSRLKGSSWRAFKQGWLCGHSVCKRVKSVSLMASMEIGVKLYLEL